MQILHTDQSNRKAVVSVFFDFSEEAGVSDFLLSMGFDPQTPKRLESPNNDNTVADLRAVLLSSFVNIFA